MLWGKINNDLHSFPTRLSFVNTPYKNVIIIIIIILNILFFSKKIRNFIMILFRQTE